MKIKKLALAAGLASASVLTVASCSGKDPKLAKTYRIATTLSPSNWNELTYQDNNDTQIMSYLSSSFFEYDYKFDSEGNIVKGDFVVKYGAATKLEDVTTKYAKDDKYDIPDSATSAYAYKITLRNDLKWNDGTPIKAEDFVYSMQEQLNPKFLNYRADSFYNGSTVIHNAENYVKQGQDTKASPNTVMKNNKQTLEEFLAANGTKKSYINWGATVEEVYENGAWRKATDADNKVVDTGLTVQQLYDVLQAKVGVELKYGTAFTDAFFKKYAYVDYKYGELSFDQVGIFKGDDDLELVLVLDSPLELLKADGSLSYKAAYNMSGLPLVKRDLFEKNKVEPVSGSTLWTSKYCSSVASTASWGPYKLTEFQAGKSYKLEKNENWYGYSLEENEGLYQTDVIACETITDYETQKLKFLAGELDEVGIDVSIAKDYRNSEQAVYTPSSYVGSLQLQSDADSLKKRESEGIDKEMLLNVKFRKAISLAFDRVAYTQTCTTSSKPGYGIFNSMHYYDVENGKAYRDTDVAKQTLCDIYGIDVTKFDSLDAAAASITGYDLTQAKALVNEAYQEALAAQTISSTDVVKLTVGTSAIDEASQRQFNFIKNTLEEMVKGTALEGRVTAELVDKGTKWAEDFRGGAYDICTGGWSGAAWDPGYFLLAYLSPEYMYSKAWKTDETMMTFTVRNGNLETGADVTETMSLMDWYDCLNGDPEASYDWSAGVIADDIRCELIAALEKQILQVYYTVPLLYNYSSALISYKIEYASRTYNTFMSYGGIKYMTYNYNDGDWAEFVNSQGGSINYTK